MSVRFLSEDNVVQQVVENIDAMDEYNAIISGCPEGKRQPGNDFGRHVRQFIWMKYGVHVSLETAFQYVGSLYSYMEEASSFFFPTPNLPTNLASTPEPLTTSQSENG
jgi:Fe-S oxidoreductase